MKTIFLIISLFGVNILSASEIHDAAQKGDLARVKALVLANNQLINEKDAEGDIPLCTSILNRHPEVSLFFIENGANLNNQNQDGFSPIYWSARINDTFITKVLIEKGANIDLVTKSNKTALSYAASHGYIGIVRLLVDNGAALETLDNYHRTPLLLATRERGGIETVKILVEGGANIDATDFFGDTPLSLAAWRGYDKIVDYLLDKDAQFTTDGKEGMKLLTYAADKRLWNLYNALIQKGGSEFLLELKEQPVLHWAAAGGSEKIVGDLINRGMQVKAMDAYRWAPLHYAAYYGRLEVGKLLIKNGADLNVKTPLGETPLYLAQLENKKDVIDFLISSGADETPSGPTQLSGKYLGQKKTEKQLELFAPGIVSRLKGGHSNIVFSPDGTEAFWTEWVLNDVGYSVGNTVWHSKIKNGVWSFPKKFLSKGDTPFFSVDGRKIFLLGTNSLPPENAEIKGIYYYERGGDELIGPKLLNFDVNNSGLYWQFSFDKDENLYFGTDEGLFRSIKSDEEYSDKENLAEIFHLDYKGGSPYISPDGTYLIFSSHALEDSFGSLDLYIGYKKSDGSWTKPINMGSTVNSTSQENLPMVSPDGKYLFLRTERDGVQGIYWVSTKIIEELRSKCYDNI